MVWQVANQVHVPVIGIGGIQSLDDVLDFLVAGARAVQVGTAAADRAGPAQTLIAAWSQGPALAPLWIGLTGRAQRLTVILAPTPGRSPHYWFGPNLAAGESFDLQIAIHAGMGPGGILWRADDSSPWSSLRAASAWGAERLTWPERWSVGVGKGGAVDCPFLGQDLSVSALLPVP